MMVRGLRPIPSITNEQVAAEWDRLAHLRCAQIESGKDLSFINVLLPMIMNLAEGLNHSDVLDVGCGAGFVTRAIAKRSNNVVGIDSSKASIEQACQRMGNFYNIAYVLAGKRFKHDYFINSI